MKALGGLALVGMLLLSGCAAPALSEPDYVKVVNGTDGLGKLSAAEIHKLGQGICAVFDKSNNAYTDALKTFTEQGIGSGPAGALIALSVNQYCPEHLGEVPGS